TWSNADRKKLPLYVRRGAIVPMLPGDVETLCDPDYVNNPEVKTWDGSLLVRIYPGGNSEFTVYDGTEISCQAGGATTNVTPTTAPRKVVLQIAVPRPTQVKRDRVVVPRNDNLDGVDSGWSFGADPLGSTAPFLFVKFPHAGGTTHVEF